MVTAAHLVSAAENLVPRIALIETEESWETIFEGLTSFRNICQDWPCDHSLELVQVIRSVGRSIAGSMTSERTRLSGAALDLVSTVAAVLGTSFEPLLPSFLPVLLSLCGRVNKVIITRANVCIRNIIESTQLPAILPYFTRHVKDKSVSIRLAVAEGTLLCMKCFNPPEFEKGGRVKDIEIIIRATVRDSHAEVRAVSRKIYEAFQILLPGRVQGFIAPLSPKMRKYLDVKASKSLDQHPVHQLTVGVNKEVHVTTTGRLLPGGKESGPTASKVIFGSSMASSSRYERSRALITTAALSGPLVEHSTVTTAAHVPLRHKLQPNRVIVTQSQHMSELPSKGFPTTSAQRLGVIASHTNVKPPSLAISSSSCPVPRAQGSSKSMSGEVQQLPQPGPRRIPLSDSHAGQLTAGACKGDVATNRPILPNDVTRPIVRRSRKGHAVKTLSASVPKPPKLPDDVREPTKFEGVMRPTFSSRSRSQLIAGCNVLDAGAYKKPSVKVPVSRRVKKDSVRCRAPILHDVTTRVEPSLIPLPPSQQVILDSDLCVSGRQISPNNPSAMVLPLHSMPANHVAPLGEVSMVDMQTHTFDYSEGNQTTGVQCGRTVTNDQNLAVFTTPCMSTALLGRPDSPGKSPISSLLSSIQRGFLFTGSPMSQC